MADRADVIHDSAALYRFIESIEAFCDVRRGFPAYLEASREFLVFVEQLAASTKKYLTDFPSKLPTDALRYASFRQELKTLRYAWFEIHRRIKPIADADTLHVPTPLISSLERRLRKVAAFQNTRFAVLHTERLNYLQVVASGIRDTTSQISSLVGSSSFPSNLGLIGIPYSQAESVFINCLIAHEIGHFVFGELQLLNNLAAKIADALNSAFAPVGVLKPEDRLRIPPIVASWVEELFCDLFAVRLVGPCYSYAFVELFDLTNNLGEDGKINPAAIGPSMEFSDSHPADMYRMQRQIGLLTKLNWWEHIKNSKSPCKRLLEYCAALKCSQFSFPSQIQLQTYFIDALDRVSGEVETAVENSLNGLDTGVDEFSRLKDTVQEYFHHGVVPSTIQDPSSKKSTSPSAVTVLNTAYQLHLDSLPMLIARVEGQSAESVEHCSNWTQKLESWTLKALEDLELIASVPTT
jgi:hypothetical protein